MTLHDLRCISLCIFMLLNVICLVYFMPGVWGVAVLLIDLFLLSIILTEEKK